MISKKREDQIYFLLNKIKLKDSDIKLIKKNEPLNLEILNEALTHSSVNPKKNHERLEFQGDAVLRLAASEYIQNNFPTLSVGERSALRSQMVSDEWLAKIGSQINIKDIMLIAPKVLKDSSATKTICAEATEALIGAMYECLRNIDSIQSWLAPHWDQESKKVLEDPYKQNPKSALQEWSQGQGLNKPMYTIKEVSKLHGDLKRFYCKVHIKEKLMGEGWGSSRKKAAKEAAKASLNKLNT
ncbi:ribonuclease III [Prochlorococcus marinus]|uniref:ribonuclease III n=1 Tax=Prochlorococcus marinus TaxID=1219 RepID=UPI0022B5750F|nr:ribonuclease III [Prochlorococcus marinus]